MKTLLLIGTALLVVGAACQQASNDAASEGATMKEGDRAPVFTLQSPDGEISLADYRGKRAVLLYFSMGPG